MISGFRREVGVNCALLGYYAASSGNSLPKFRDSLSVLSSGVKNSKNMGPIGCPEMSVRSYHYSLRNNTEERISHYMNSLKRNLLVYYVFFFLPNATTQVIEGKIKGQIEVTRRRGRRRKKLLDDLKDRRGYCQLKEETLDRTMWRNRFGRGFGPVV